MLAVTVLLRPAAMALTHYITPPLSLLPPPPSPPLHPQ